KDQNGKRRDTAKVWPPKNGNASIHAVPSEQETFLVLKSAGNSPQEDSGSVVLPKEAQCPNAQRFAAQKSAVFR
ncbi:MAG: hypothetical protein ABJP33_01420, partial [Pseudoruegeria sp.]